MSSAAMPLSDVFAVPPVPTDWRAEAMQRRIRRRYAAERRFRLLGAAAVLLSAAFLAFLLWTMVGNGLRGFQRREVTLALDFTRTPVAVTPEQLRSKGAALALAAAGLEDRVENAVIAGFGPDAPDLVADSAWVEVRDAIIADPAKAHGLFTLRIEASPAIDAAARGDGTPAAVAKVARLRARDLLHSGFDWGFFTAADATDPGAAGIWGALKGSVLTMAVTLLLAFPVGVLAATWLEEYAPPGRWSDLIEVSINNLAAVPSIIFGLLGLAVFLGTFGMPRSSPVVAGMTLALMTMPVIVIASRAAIRAVPGSVREAALGLGASPVQVVVHHVLPQALPGILTGTIIGMARALGETAPLLMIGMRAFIATPPRGLDDPATVLPVQIFLWSDEVGRGFVEKTSAAILVLLAVLLTMNGLAIYLRNRLERRR